MDQSTLLWTVDATRGTVNFGRLMPFAGNTYELVFAGVDIEEVYTAYVMDESALKCLAKSQHNAGEYTIAFNTADLRDEFERNMHEVKSFHVIVRDSKRVVAEGDLCVQWQSLWEDATTGEVFTMKGNPGEPGAPGKQGRKGDEGKSAYEVALQNGFEGTAEEWLKTLVGSPGQATMAYCTEDDKWYGLSIVVNDLGEKVLKIAEVGQEANSDLSSYVSRTDDQTILGEKKFLKSPLVPTIEKDDDGAAVVDVENDSQKVVNTNFLKIWWDYAKTLFVATEEHIWNLAQTFKVAPVVKFENLNLDVATSATLQRIYGEVVDVNGSTALTSKFTQTNANKWICSPAILERTVNGVRKTCEVTLSIDASGKRSVDLTAADEVLAPTVKDQNDYSDKIATTKFVANALSMFGGVVRGLGIIKELPLHSSSSAKTEEITISEQISLRFTGATLCHAYIILCASTSSTSTLKTTITDFCSCEETLSETINPYGFKIIDLYDYAVCCVDAGVKICSVTYPKNVYGYVIGLFM